MSIFKGPYTSIPVKETLRPLSIIVTVIVTAFMVPYFLIFAVGLLGGFIQKFENFSNFLIENIFTIGLVLICFVLVLYLFKILKTFSLHRKFEKRQLDIEEWGKANNAEVLRNQDLKLYSDSILVRLNLRDLEVKTLVKNKEFVVGDIYFNTYTKTKNGENLDRHIYQNTVVLPLSRQVPNIFFDSKKYRAKALFMVFKNNQEDELEANFGKYFSIHSPQNYHIDLRSIITPDTMEALTRLKDCDIEISGKSLIIYSPLCINTKESLDAILDLAKELKSQIEDNINTYIDQRLSRTEGRLYIHPSGYKLKLRNLRLIKFIAWVIFYILLYVVVYIFSDK